MNKTVKSFFTVSGFAVATRALSFLFKMWMSRSLGAETVGLYQIALSIILLLFSLTAGAPTVLSRKVAGVSGDKAKQNGFVTSSLIIGLSVGIVLVGLALIFNKHLDVLFADDRCVKLFLIMLPTLITSTIYGSLRSWFWGQKKFLTFSSTELLEEVVRIAVASILAGGVVSAIDGGTAVAIAFTVSDLACALVLAIIFFVKGGRICKPQDTKEIFKSTLPLSTMRILTSLTVTITALIIPSRLVDSGMTLSHATAEYGRIAGMAFPMIMAPSMVISALAVVLIPDIASLAKDNDFSAIKTKYKASLIFSALVSGFAFMIYLPFGKHLGIIFFGDEHAGEFISYCAPMLFPMALGQVTTPMLNSLGLEKRTFSNYILGAVVMIPAVLFLPKYVGVYAVAIGMGVSHIITAVLNSVTIFKKLGGQIGTGKAVSVVGYSIPLGVIGLFTNQLLDKCMDKWLSMVISGVLVVVLFVVCTAVFNVVDIKGYVKMFSPAESLSLKRKDRTQRLCRKNSKLPLKRLKIRQNTK